MSILPTPHIQGHNSSSSPSDLSLNPSSEHGNNSSVSPLSTSPSEISSPGIGSLCLAGPSFTTPDFSGGSREPIAAAEEGRSRGSSKEMTQTGSWKESSSPPNADQHDHCRYDGRRNRSRGRTTGAAQLQHNTTGPFNSPRGVSHHNPTGRRANVISGNHLLNFQYDPISPPQSRGPPPPQRRQMHKRRPYNKDLFLQANYKFVMLDTGDHSPDSMDPDRMLQWENIIFVRYSTPSPVQCPICLEYPLCPQITSCGHIFCFPCILQYLLMGVDNHKAECFKRCPLCFVMISPRELYTVYIENVKQYFVGNPIEFTLLTRKKDSFAPTRKNEYEEAFPNGENEIHDPFSKFTFTQDVDLSVRQAVSELDNWIARADPGLVADLEKHLYVNAALERLEQRKLYWNEHKLSNYSNTRRTTKNQASSFTPPDISRVGYQARSLENRTTTCSSNDQDISTKVSSVNKSDEESPQFSFEKSCDNGYPLDDPEAPSSSSRNGSKGPLLHQSDTKDLKDNDAYNFYQSADGQHIILHTLNMKCLLHHYGNYDLLPPRVSGKILEMETVTQSEAIRRRYRFLSHFSLTTTFQICEIDMRESLPPNAFAPFMDEIKKREKQRKERARKDRKDKIKAEVAAAAELSVLMASLGQSSRDDFPPFSLDDFEALGNTAPISSSPPNMGERSSFSHVTRLGFAAGHDSPNLNNEPTSVQSSSSEVTNATAGARNTNITSFASVTSRTPSAPVTITDSGKKGKKPSRVLLSTTSVRRY